MYQCYNQANHKHEIDETRNDSADMPTKREQIQIYLSKVLQNFENIVDALNEFSAISYIKNPKWISDIKNGLQYECKETGWYFFESKLPPSSLSCDSFNEGSKFEQIKKDWDSFEERKNSIFSKQLAQPLTDIAQRKIVKMSSEFLSRANKLVIALNEIYSEYNDIIINATSGAIAGIYAESQEHLKHIVNPDERKEFKDNLKKVLLNSHWL